mmetsp:Transcript_116427/g.267303  ORF Transcript_116427/g.267303 Transcript_116427/m.267303 type:complete len:93 (-) Transcript_116427:66-344(-)
MVLRCNTVVETVLADTTFARRIHTADMKETHVCLSALAPSELQSVRWHNRTHVLDAGVGNGDLLGLEYRKNRTPIDSVWGPQKELVLGTQLP